MRKILFVVFVLLTVFSAGFALAHQPRLVEQGSGVIEIKNPEISQAFYAELTGQPHNYLIDEKEGFNLYLNLLVPKTETANILPSANVFQSTTSADRILFAQLLAENSQWPEFYEPFGADYYLEGPELEVSAPAGKYFIEVFNALNQGKYVLAVGKKEEFPLNEIINTYLTLPKLKTQFFNSSIFTLLKSPLILAPLVFLVFVVGLIILLIVIKKRRKQKQ